jgi:hypothetical protein
MLTIATTAQRPSPPNSTSDRRSPFESRWASAQIATPVSCGWRTKRLRLVGTFEPMNNTSETNIATPVSRPPGAGGADE